MASITWKEVLTQSVTSGPGVFVVSGRVSCIPTPNRITLPNCYFYPGLVLRLSLAGQMNSVATNVRGSIRFEVGVGANATQTVFDSLPIEAVSRLSLNKPLLLTIELTCVSIGIDTATRFVPSARVQCESLVGSALPASGGSSSFLLPNGAPPDPGAGADSTAASTIDLFCTTKGTNTFFQAFDYRVEALN